MSELMLVNPRRKRRKSKRRMTAKQALYFGGGRKRRRSKRRRVSLLASNPVARRTSRRRRRGSRRVRHLRRNPIRLNPRSFVSGSLMPAGIGAVGALGVDLALGYGSPYLPAMLQSGIGNTIARLAGAIGVGYVVGMVGGKKFGEEAMAGAITVTLYDILKSTVKTSVPGLPLSGYSMGWISPGMQTDGLGVYVGNDNAYSGRMNGMGMYVENESDYIRTA